MVLDKRIQILDIQTRHMEEENALIIKKRKLEIELLEIELANKKKIKILKDFLNFISAFYINI